MDLTGMIYGRLKVLYRYPADYITPSTGKHTSRWFCLCECGNTSIVSSSQLRSGKTQSCGCLQRERSAQAHTTHGGRYDRLHMMWANMKNRCFNPKYAEYKDYGGRGISVCEDWHTYEAFRDWALNMGYQSDAVRGKQTLDRIDIDGDYCPENCRLVDMYAQANNKQNTIKVKYHDQTLTLGELSQKVGITYNRLYYLIRTKGLSAEEAINCSVTL